MEPLENCSVCGDRVPGGDHDCWVLKKASEFPTLTCARCGSAMYHGECLRWTCRS